MIRDHVAVNCVEISESVGSYFYSSQRTTPADTYVWHKSSILSQTPTMDRNNTNSTGRNPKMAAPGSVYCAPCNSFSHAQNQCPMSFPRTYQPVSNNLVGSNVNIGTDDFYLISQLAPDRAVIDQPTATLNLELQIRKALSKGFGNGGKRCDKHRRMQMQMLDKAPWDPKENEPFVADAFDDSFVVTRTLLPICSVCVRAETGFEQTALADRLDMCRCASMVEKADCPNCVLGEINGAMKYEVLMRKKPGADEGCEVACRCGNKVDAAKTARQCAYCHGIATAPFYGYGGQKLQFGSGTEATAPRGDV